MGFFDVFKKDAKHTEKDHDTEWEKIEEEAAAERVRLLALTPEELLALSDEDFIDAIVERDYEKVKTNGIDALSPEARAFFVANTYSWACYELRILLLRVRYAPARNVLLRYFTSDESIYATELSAALETVGAREYKQLFEHFLWDNKLSVEELCAFNERELKKRLGGRLPFSSRAFDKQMRALDQAAPLADICETYALQHREAFC